MSDNKKYYYLKLVDNFYDRDEMIMLESMPDGYMYSNILLKLYLRSLKNEGKLMFNNRIPYNANMLANVTRFPVAVVEKAIAIFKELGLIEVLDNGAIYMLDIQNFIGKSSTEADRKRLYRSKIEEEKKSLGQMSDKTPPEKEIELDIDIEKEIDTDINNSSSNKTSLEDVIAYYRREIVNRHVLTKLEQDFFLEIGNKVSYDLVIRAMEISIESNVRELRYIKGIIKRWTDENIKTLEQLETYKLQQQSKQKGVKSDVRRREGITKTESTTDNRESEEARRAELRRRIQELDEL